eukprot:14313473-Ditylum_brightwellii.AAC.1
MEEQNMPMAHLDGSLQTTHSNSGREKAKCMATQKQCNCFEQKVLGSLWSYDLSTATSNTTIYQSTMTSYSIFVTIAQLLTK